MKSLDHAMVHVLEWIFLDQVLTVNKIYGTGLNIYEFFGTNVNTCITEIFGTAITF